MITNPIKRLMRAGILTGVVDGTFSSVLVSVFYGSTVMRLFQGVAATVLGTTAFEGGRRAAMIGLAMHFGVAFAWSALFLVLTMNSPALQRFLMRRHGVTKVAAVYGPSIWLVMSLIVIPTLLRKPPTINIRWWIQLIGHFPFVGLPIVWCIASGIPLRAWARRRPLSRANP